MLAEMRPARRALAVVVALVTALLSIAAWADTPANEDGDRGTSPFDAIMKQNAPAPRPSRQAAEPARVTDSDGARRGDGGTVEVPLAEYTELARRLDALRARRGRDAGPPVVLGGATYEGEVTQGVLALRMKLHVTLTGDGLKTVPLVGDDVALVSATAGGEAAGDPSIGVGRDSAFAGPSIGVTRRPGYHVWITDRRGPVTLDVAFLVPPRGPRGSIEYAFRAARTPSTALTVRLPAEGLAPRFDGAVQSEVRADKGGTVVRATLEPTTEIRVVGFRDLGRDEGRAAKVYAETMTLLSVDEPGIELFTVVHYNILYGGTQSFELQIPDGLEVVSADGEGAFRHVLDRRGDATVLRGETAFPVQGAYELSLRLRRKGNGAPSAQLDVELPHCLGVEREHGWLAVEVPGKLRLDEKSRADLIGVDVQKLPSEILASAVSPILKAYRYHSASPALRLGIERLPERELADGAIDRIDAVSVLSAEGKLLTELRISLRNTLRPSLAIALPDATSVRSALLDGESVKPSRDDKGRLLLPLKRSRGEERPEPFTLEVVLESERAPLGVAGASALALPAADLTAAVLHWKLHLPASNEYGDLRAAIAPQRFAGAASWHKPAHLTRAVRWDEDDGETATGERSRSGGPARIELPRTGIEIDYDRYWVSAGESVRVEVPYIRSWLLLPIKLALAMLLAALLGRTPLSAPAMGRPRSTGGGGRPAWLGRAVHAIACAVIAIALWRLGGPLLACGAALAGAALLSERRWSRAEIARALRAYVSRMPSRLAAWRSRQVFSPRRTARAIALAAGFTIVSWVLAERAARLALALASLSG